MITRIFGANMKKLFVAVLFVLFGTQSFAQNSNKGSEAYKAGNYAEAEKWFRLSAEQGNTDAQNMLGYMYYKGKVVLKDYAEAEKWFRLSAELGYDRAQSNLGRMYEEGNSVLQDYLTAHMWYNIASANWHKEAGKYRDEDAAQMTPEDISKATAMARECMNSNYKNCGY